jgi:hypothetical protein
MADLQFGTMRVYMHNMIYVWHMDVFNCEGDVGVCVGG